jgi:hypothetical protein
MTPEQTVALLAYASAIDARIRRNDPQERQLQVRAWQTQLAAVDPQDAAAAVDTHYAQPNVSAAMPGDIAGRARAIRAARRRDNLERAGDAATLPVGVDPDNVPAYLAALRDARDRIADGEEPPALDVTSRRSLRLDGVFRQVPRVNGRGGAA